MKNKYGIGLFILLFLLIYFMTYGAYHEFKNVELEKKQKDSIMTIDNQVIKGFYLYEVNGYVVVYESDKKTPFEYTDIIYADLPELVRKEIRNGKYIKNEEELYGFLENYTS